MHGGRAAVDRLRRRASAACFARRCCAIARRRAGDGGRRSRASRARASASSACAAESGRDVRRRPGRDGHRRDARRDARPLRRPRARRDRRRRAATRRCARRPRASGRPATSASTTPCVHGRRLRVEHWEVARAQGAHRRPRDAGRRRALRRDPVLLDRTSPTGRRSSTSGPPRRLGPRGRARLDRRRRVHGLLPRRRRQRRSARSPSAARTTSTRPADCCATADCRRLTTALSALPGRDLAATTSRMISDADDRAEQAAEVECVVIADSQRRLETIR